MLRKTLSLSPPPLLSSATLQSGLRFINKSIHCGHRPKPFDLSRSLSAESTSFSSAKERENSNLRSSIERRKIGIIGCGFLGSSIALHAAFRGIGDITLLDTNEGKAFEKAYDLQESAHTLGIDAKYHATANYAELQDAEAIIITANNRSSIGLSRRDMFQANRNLVNEIAPALKNNCPKAFILCLTRPFDLITASIQRATAIPPNHVTSMAGVLASTRLKRLLAERLRVGPSEVGAHVLGGQGEKMVFIGSETKICNEPLSSYIAKGMINEKEIEKIFDRTITLDSEITGKYSNSIPFYAYASSAVTVIESYLFDLKKILPVNAFLSGQYGITNHYIGVPCVIGKNGIEEIIEISLDERETQEFKRVANYLINAQKELAETVPLSRHKNRHA